MHQNVISIFIHLTDLQLIQKEIGLKIGREVETAFACIGYLYNVIENEQSPRVLQGTAGLVVLMS